MSKFPILNVKNYSEMLTKLGWYNWVVTVVCILMLRHFVPPVAALSNYIDEAVPEGVETLLPFPASMVGVAVISIVVALIAHAIKLHDRLSDLFRIRNEFDVNYVLYPLAVASGSQLSPVQFAKIRQTRKRLMGSTFYTHASSTSPAIDSHTITQALTNWSWFWVCLEAIALLAATAVVLSIYGAWPAAGSLLIACAVLLVLMRFFRLQSAQYAESQVEQILRDDVRRTAVAAEFNAL